MDTWHAKLKRWTRLGTAGSSRNCRARRDRAALRPSLTKVRARLAVLVLVGSGAGSHKSGPLQAAGSRLSGQLVLVDGASMTGF